MKLILLLVVSCLFLQNGKGAPRTAVYNFVKCKPESDQANCVTQKAEIPWSPNLPSKLPASVGEYLNAKPVEDESPLREEMGKEMEEEETPIRSEDEESPDMFVGDEGSGESEGSAPWIAAAESETGSGDNWTDNLQQEGETFFSNYVPVGETKPTEQDLKEDHLLSP